MQRNHLLAGPLATCGFSVRIAAIMAIAAGCLILASPANAAPYAGDIFEIAQPDGAILSLRVWGDEYYTVAETLDGYTVVPDPVTGEICYAEPQPQGRDLRSSGVAVRFDQPWPGLQKHLRPGREIVQEKVRRSRAHFAEHEARTLKELYQWRKQRGRQIRGRRDALLVDPAAVLAEAGIDDDDAITAEALDEPIEPATVGNVLGLTLIIDFSDDVATIPAANINAFCNQASGYTGYSNNGSVRQYFNDVSGGLLDYTNYVPPVYYCAAQPKSYYTDPDIGYGTRARDLIREALNSLEAQGHDFSVYDGDHDGDIDALNCLYAGGADSAWSVGLWPHASSLSWNSNDGVRAFRYQITNIGGSLTIRTFCHENGHMLLGWPDFYDYDYDSRGLGNWCLMGFGGSNTNPVPPHPELKRRAGWATITELTASQTNIALPNASTNQFYRFTHWARNQEYFLVSSHRRGVGRESSLPDSGLALWLVDNANGGRDNQQMTYAQHRVTTLIQADGAWDLENNRDYGDSDDLFDAAGVSEVSGSTNPSTRWWDGGPSGWRLFGISSPGATMTFSAQKNTAGQTPFGGSNHSLPAVIEIEDYDVSGETNAAWNDTTSGNSGGDYRWDNVDINTTTDGGDGYLVGWTVGGEWLEYTVDIVEGVYDIQLRCASPNSGRSLVVKLAGDTLGTISVPNTGSFSNWTTVTLPAVYIPAGAGKVLRLEIVGGGYDLNWIRFERRPQSPFGNMTRPVPGRIEAEDYDLGGELVAYHDTSSGNSGGQYRGDDVDIVSIAADEYAVWTSTGEWTEYTVDLTPGRYNIDVRLACGFDGRSIELAMDGQSFAAATVPNTGDNYAWQTLRFTDVEISGGASSVLRLAFPSGGYNIDRVDFSRIDQWPYGESAPTLPGAIQAEDFDEGGQGYAYYDSSSGNSGGQYRTGEDVDIVTADLDYAVWTSNGEWLEYTVDVPVAGQYNLAIRAGCPYSGRSFRLRLDGALLATISVPVTTNMNTYFESTIPVTLPQGLGQVLRVEIVTGGFTLDRLAFTLHDPCAAIQAQPGYTPLAGDLNTDCYVDAADLAALTDGWLAPYDLADYADLAQTWLRSDLE